MYLSYRQHVLLALALGAIGLSGPLPGPACAADPYQQLAQREFGTADEALEAIAAEIQAATPDKLPAIEGRLIAVIESPAATLAGKQFACQMLRLAGSGKCTAALSKLLTDEKLSHSACYALQQSKDPAVTQLLCQALGKTQGQVKLGIVSTLGDRGAPAALEPLAKLLADQDAAIVGGALRAMGRIGGPRAAQIIQSAKAPAACETARAHAALACAASLPASDAAAAGKIYERLLAEPGPAVVKGAALLAIARQKQVQAVKPVLKALQANDATLRRAARGAILAMPGPAVSKAFAAELDKLPPAGKAALLEALAARGEAQGLSSLVNGLLTAPEEEVRLAAIRAVARLGNAQSVGLLSVRLAESGPARDAATKSLAKLQAEGTVAALLAAAKSDNAGIRASVLEVLTERRQAEALPTLRKATADGDAKVRRAALKGLAFLGSPDDLAPLVALLLATKEDPERELSSRALMGIAGRTADKNVCYEPLIAGLNRATDQGKISLLAVLPVLGGSRGYAVLREQLAASKDVKKAAVRALAEWPDNAPLADLLAVARDPSDRTTSILALRGHIRLIGLAGKPADRLKAYQQALQLAARPDEKKLVLAGLAEVHHLDALRMVEACLDDAALKREALQASEKVAEALSGRNPQEARAALERVLAGTNDQGLREKTQKALNKLQFKQQNAPAGKGK